MRHGLIGIFGAGLLASTMATNGCSSGGTPANNTSSNGGSNANGGSPSNGGSGGNSQSTSAVACSNVAPCGGSVVGTWTATSSCLTLSGSMDVTLTSLGCATVPVTGSLQVSGTWTANADGTYTDNTTTAGSVTFPLAPSCLSISSVPVTCEKAGTIFSSLGWNSAVCTSAGGQCSCSASANQKGGLGIVSGNPVSSGIVTTASNVVTNDDGFKYSYCVSGSTLTFSPQASALTGTVVLQKSGPSGSGGATGSGGQTGLGGATGSGGTVGSGGGATRVTGGTVGAGGTRPTGGTTSSSGGTTSSSGGTTSSPGGTTSSPGGKGGAAGSGGTTSTGGTSSSPGGKGGGGGTTATGGSVAAGGSPGNLPCDIYAAANNTCLAAHSTIRLIVSAYTGPLYQVYRSSDKTTKDIPILSGAVVADSSVQDTFCQGATCTITKIYDQSGHGNFLEAETPTDPVSSVGGYQGETAAKATAEKLNVGGHPVYSLYTNAKQAYWHDGSKSGMQTGNVAMGIYMVTSGKHFNGGCCYDYGNGETTRTYVAGWSINAVNFGNQTTWGTGAGTGPWVMADLEDGLFSGGSSGNNPSNPTQTATYVTAIEKADGPGAQFALRGGDATSGSLGTYYSGKPPKGGMKLQGAVLLGSGGDCCYSNNNASAGTFYEGAMVSGYPSDATENSVQANIVSAGYGK
jgi:non-reducing end alpha-L-arabinofuranosidase